jgi:hypothetical protein
LIKIRREKNRGGGVVVAAARSCMVSREETSIENDYLTALVPVVAEDVSNMSGRRNIPLSNRYSHEKGWSRNLRRWITIRMLMMERRSSIGGIWWIRRGWRRRSIRTRKTRRRGWCKKC